MPPKPTTNKTSKDRVLVEGSPHEVARVARELLKQKKRPGKRERLASGHLTEKQEAVDLERRIKEETPARGHSADSGGVARTFAELPLSRKTQQGLRERGFTTLTDIQRACLLPALAGRDVVGAAKTGSGKTLAFAVPVVELLFRLGWSGDQDGLGALIISPTRELALQTFDVIKAIGHFHTLSCGLVIGGKSFEAERRHITSVSILVCTPGRLLQHLDETSGFSCANLRVLVLDECDRLLDLGFASTLDGIVAHLPKERQTLLFSATQNNSVHSLARVNMIEPEYFGVHDTESQATPSQLQQGYAVVELPDKFDVLWSFIKTHLRAKTLVFMSSCKQVKFARAALSRMRPGVSLMELHGKTAQMKRMATFLHFCQAPAAVLFATDIAARGLDFPAVDWVVQFDCPEDADAYIHRVGRTARNTRAGSSMLFLMPSERAMLDRLEKKRVHLEEMRIKTNRLQSIRGTMQGLLAEDVELKILAQRAFISYFRSVHLHKDKEIFDVFALPATPFAESLGLVSTPQLKFGKKPSSSSSSSSSSSDQQPSADQQQTTSKTKAKPRKVDVKNNSSLAELQAAVLRERELLGLSVDTLPPVSLPKETKKEKRTQIDRLLHRQSKALEEQNKLRTLDDDQEDFLVLKRKDPNFDDNDNCDEAAAAKRVIKKKITEVAPELDNYQLLSKDISIMKRADEVDAARQKELLRARRLEKKLAVRAQRRLERPLGHVQPMTRLHSDHQSDDDDDDDNDDDGEFDSDNDDDADGGFDSDNDGFAAYDDEDSDEEAPPSRRDKRTRDKSKKDKSKKDKSKKKHKSSSQASDLGSLEDQALALLKGF